MQYIAIVLCLFHCGTPAILSPLKSISAGRELQMYPKTKFEMFVLEFLKIFVLGYFF